MDYPKEFSEAAIASVYIARIKADETYRKSKPTLEAAVVWIVEVFFAYAKECCSLAESRRWSIDRADKEAQEGLRRVAIEANSRFPSVRWLMEGHHLSRAGMLAIEAHERWAQYQDQLLRAATLLQPIQFIPPTIPPSLEGQVPVLKLKPVRSTTAIQIENRMNECRWTQEELAEKIRVHPSTVWRHISGAQIPRISLLRQYEDAFSKHLKTKVVIDRNASKRK